MESIFIQLSLVMVIVATMSIVMRILKQPLVVGYILSGIIVGPAFLGLIKDHQTFESFSEIGIALLLFIVGLGLDISVIRTTLRPIATVFITNIAILILFGLGIGQLFQLSIQESIILGIALIFSSTIVVIKSLSDKKELHRLYGQMTVGILIFEDLLAAIVLLAVAIIKGSAGTLNIFEMFPIFAAVLFITLLLYLAHSVILPKLSHFLSSSQELLYAFSLAWAFGIAALSLGLGLSMEVGALFAGVSMATMKFAQETSSRLKPLRDFFLILFFVALGEKLNLNHLVNSIPLALCLSIVALMIKPIIVQTTLGLLGYTKQVGFKTAIHLSQISEFSIILTVLALSSGLIRGEIVEAVTLTAMITLGISSYLMHYDDQLFKRLIRPLGIFEREEVKTEKKSSKHYKLVLIGYHKGGHEFINTFRDMKKPYIVIDYNPAFIEIMDRQHIHNIYGDATDYELLDELEVHKADIVISTISETAANMSILKYLHRRNPNISFICHAQNLTAAAKLYNNNAVYVMLPHLVGSQRLSDFIRRHGTKKTSFESYRRIQLSRLGRSALK